MGLVPKLLIGATALTATILTATQTFGQFSAASERHRITAIRCRTLLRELEMQRMHPPRTREEAQGRMTRLHQSFSDMESDAPLISASLREPPDERRLEQDLKQIAQRAKSVTGLGHSLWEYADASQDLSAKK